MQNTWISSLYLNTASYIGNSLSSDEIFVYLTIYIIKVKALLLWTGFTHSRKFVYWYSALHSLHSQKCLPFWDRKMRNIWTRIWRKQPASSQVPSSQYAEQATRKWSTWKFFIQNKLQYMFWVYHAVYHFQSVHKKVRFAGFFQDYQTKPTSCNTVGRKF